MSLSILTIVSDAHPKRLGGPECLKEKRQTKTLTPLSGVQLMHSLREGYVEMFGEQPTKQRLAMAWAQIALENGQGKYLWNHNLGNIGPGTSEQEYYVHSDYTTYRSFDGYLNGAIAYWKHISRSTILFKHFNEGNPHGVAISLRNSGYYGAELEPYSKGMSELYAYALNVVIPKELLEVKNVGQSD